MQDPLAGAERFEQRTGPDVGEFRVEPGRVEQLHIVAPLPLAVQRTGQNGDRLTGRDGVTATDDGVGQRHSVELGNRW